MSPAQLAQLIDHTLLAPETGVEQVNRVVQEAMEYRFASCCVAPLWVRQVAGALHEAGLRVCTVAGFPHGTSKATVKAIEATAAIKDGADEVDVVAHLPNLLVANVEAARAELIETVKAARAARRDVVIKVIVESALLLKDGTDLGEQRIAAACRAVRESGCDFIKTSTGYHPAGGASRDAVQLMKKHSSGILVKAAGGIRTLAIARQMIEAGADRIGCSASVSIINEMQGGASSGSGSY